MTELRTLAHIRTGDKGDTCQFSVTAHDPRDYPRLARHLSTERVGDHFSEIANGRIVRFEMPQLGALIFVLEHALRSGVTRSLSLDAHGKCLGATLLGIDIPDAPDATAARTSNTDLHMPESE